MPVTLNIYPPILGLDGRDQDNPDLFGEYASHCSRLVPQIYAQEAHAVLYPDSRGRKDCTLPGAPLQEKKARIPVGNTKEHHPPELPLFFCGYPCTIYEKCCKERYSLNRITKEKYHEGPPLFDTENKIFQDVHYYT